VKGADGVRDQIVSLLQFEVARKVPLLRTAWDLQAVSMPEIEQLVSGEPPDLVLDSSGNTWVNVINPRFLSTRRVDIRRGLPVYLTRYSCRVYVWSKSDSWAEAIASRDHLAVACRLSLLEYPNLSPGARGDTGYRLHENTYTEEFGEPFRVRNPKGNRAWAGAVLAIDADVEETLEDGSTRTPIGDPALPNTLTITAEAAGPGQPLPGEE
jgi:hypothetical protein